MGGYAGDATLIATNTLPRAVAWVAFWEVEREGVILVGWVGGVWCMLGIEVAVVVREMGEWR